MNVVTDSVAHFYSTSILRNTRAFYSTITFRNRGEGSRAWVTSINSWHDIVGVLTLVKSLKDTKTRYPILILVDKQNVGLAQLEELRHVDCTIIPIEATKPRVVENSEAAGEGAYRGGLRGISGSWTMLHVFSLAEFDRVAYLDPSVMVLQNMDDLFDAAPPKRLQLHHMEDGVGARSKASFARGHQSYRRSELLARSRCLCHEPDAEGQLSNRNHCPYTKPRPGISRPERRISASVMVFSPDISLFEEMQRHLLRRGVPSSANNPQDFLSEWFGGYWCELPKRDVLTKIEALYHPESFDFRLSKTRALAFNGIRPWTLAREDLEHLKNKPRVVIAPFRPQSSVSIFSSFPSLYSLLPRWKQEQLTRATNQPKEEYLPLGKALQLERTSPELVRLYLKWWGLFDSTAKALGRRRKRKARFAFHSIEEHLQIPRSTARKVAVGAAKVLGTLKAGETRDWLEATIHAVKKCRLDRHNPAYSSVKRLLCSGTQIPNEEGI